jgi:hypothetical protein
VTTFRIEFMVSCRPDDDAKAVPTEVPLAFRIEANDWVDALDRFGKAIQNALTWGVPLPKPRAAVAIASVKVKP